MRTKKNIKKHNKTKKNIISTICTDIKSVENGIVTKFKKDLKNSSLAETFNLEDYILELIKNSKKFKTRPQDDFYTYINEKWLENYKPLPGQNYLTKQDDFRLIQDKVYKDVEDILKEYVKKHQHSKDPFDISFINFYKATENHFINHKDDKTLIKRAHEVVTKIDEFIDNNNKNLLELLSWINTNDLVSWGLPIIWNIKADNQFPTLYRSYVSGPKLTLLDVNVYFDDETHIEYKKIYRNQYFSYLNKLFEYFFGKNHTYNIIDVFNVETKIANAYACNKSKETFDYKFHKITTKESMEKLGFDWSTYCKYLGFKNTPQFYYTSDINYIQCIFKTLSKEWNTQEWRTYWIYIHIRMIARFNDDSSNLYYNFNAIFQKGAGDRPNFNLLMVIPLSYAFNTFLSNEYAKKYTNENYLKYIKIISEDLKKVFIRILKRNTWLDPLTKKKTIEKVEYIKMIVGSPDYLYTDPILDYNDSTLWLNLVKTSEFYHKRNIRLEGKKFVEQAILDWSQVPGAFVSNQSYNVNAFYTPSTNSIYIPLGYIQYPFIDIGNRSFIYNIAYIGLTIAHELAHSLDEWGRQYDKNGKFGDWWTKNDKKTFYNIQKGIVKQIETYALRDGIKYDGWINIGELIADITGFTITREYLRDYLYVNKTIFKATLLSFELFFTFVALQYRQKINKLSVFNEVKTNPHPLGKYRCNVIFSRSRIFRELYNVKKGDGMWWPVTTRIWET
jgi:putative endopeptidase